jgi:hypothetical protein
LKEWLEVRSGLKKDWLELVREALEFVGTWSERAGLELSSDDVGNLL